MSDLESGRSEPLVVGRVTGLYGVKGWVKIHSHTDPRENIVKYKPWLMKTRQGWEERKVLSGKRHGKTVVARLEGVDDREVARALIGQDIAITREQLPPPPLGEYYWVDLQGCRVETVDGVELGIVDYLVETGANDVMVVKGERERLIPLIEPQFVKQVNLQEKLIKVDWDPEF